jgi:hypothetical protein
MFTHSIRDFKLKSGTIIPAGTLANVTPFNLTTANVKFQGETYNVYMTDLHKWFDEFEEVDIHDLETSNYKNDWPVEILA